MQFNHRRLVVAATTLGLASAVLLFAAPAQAQAISVSLNGNNLNLNPPPIERAGRVFVPLRGIFEQLGATVVYSNGQINATSGRHTVSLNIGSQQATVDGQQQTLDVAPFIVGASTYVPLRFVSQALGAQVNWDGNNQLVSVTSYGVGGPGGPGPGAMGRQRPDQNGGMGMLSNERPRNGAIVPSRDLRIMAQFNQNVDPNSLRIRLDGVDVTAGATRTANGFEYVPSASLQASQHTVLVRGRDVNGQPVSASWTFTTGNGGM
jgi:hypothetical protein